MAEYEKIKLITFPLENDHFLLVTTEVESDQQYHKQCSQIIEKLNPSIENFKIHSDLLLVTI